MIEMEVQRVQVSSRAYHRVVLRAKEGDANLHIVIGPAEARAISMAHRGQKPTRPLSYRGSYLPAMLKFGCGDRMGAGR